jgi:hypothetical protein
MSHIPHPHLAVSNRRIRRVLVAAAALASVATMHTSAAHADSTPTGEFTALTPARILDTRDGTGGFSQPIGPGQSVDVQVAGIGGVPATGVSSVVFNATAVDPTAATYLTVWPAGIARPVISNVNVRAGETRPNLVTVALGTGGKVSLYNNGGLTHAIFDVVGFYSDASGPAGSRFHPSDPFRLFDTRDGTGGVPAAAISAGGTLKVPVIGRGPVPLMGVTAVVLNVTVTAPTSPGYLTVFPSDVAVPTASNLNFVPNQTVPNLVTVRVPVGGVISFFNSGGSTHVLADIVGYYDGQRIGDAGRFVGVTPTRRLDTRDIRAAIKADDYGVLTVAGYQGIPANATGAVLNVTATNTTAPGFLTIFPDDNCTIPTTSNLNFQPGDSVANQVVTRLSLKAQCSEAAGAGAIDIYNSNGTTDVIVDVFGYFL